MMPDSGINEALPPHLQKYWDVMKDGQWHSITELRKIFGPEADIARCLRQFRSKKYGMNRYETKRINGVQHHRVYPSGMGPVEQCHWCGQWKSCKEKIGSNRICNDCLKKMWNRKAEE